MNAQSIQIQTTSFIVVNFDQFCLGSSCRRPTHLLLHLPNFDLQLGMKRLLVDDWTFLFACKYFLFVKICFCWWSDHLLGSCAAN